MENNQWEKKIIAKTKASNLVQPVTVLFSLTSRSVFMGIVKMEVTQLATPR